LFHTQARVTGAQDFQIISPRLRRSDFAPAVKKKTGVITNTSSDFQHGAVLDGEFEAGKVFLPPLVVSLIVVREENIHRMMFNPQNPIYKIFYEWFHEGKTDFV
jgi:hypothetical protein